MDLGPDGFLARRPEALTLIHELGLDDQLEAVAASGASLWLRGSLHEIPSGLALGVPTSSSSLKSMGGLSWRARAHARRDELFPVRLAVGDDASIGDIVRAKLGSELSYQFIEPMVGGIQAGRIDDLSALSVFPALLQAARHGGSLMKALKTLGAAGPSPSGPTTPAPAPGPMFCSLVNGVGSLPVELARQLAQRQVVLRTNVRVSALRRSPAGDYPWEVDTDTTATPADAVVIATNGAVAGDLLHEFDPAFEGLSALSSASAAMVTFCVPRPNITLPQHGTGILVPLATDWSGSSSMMITAVTFLDVKWPHLRHDDDVVVRAHVGRIDDVRSASMSDDELVTRVAQELAVLLGHFESPLETLVQRWPDGLPQYYVGHERMVQRAKAACGALRLALAGNAYDGVGIPASIGSGRRAAREVLALLQQ